MQKKILWAMLIYFVASLYYAGVLMMLHFVLYPSLNSVQQNIVPVMETFGHRIIIVCYISAILMLMASLVLIKWGNKFLIFNKKRGYLSIIQFFKSNLLISPFQLIAFQFYKP